MVESEDVKKAEIDRLYKENVSKVYRTALYYVEDHYVAEEIVQEVFLKLYDNLGDICMESVPAWLITTAKNMAKNYLRDSKLGRHRWKRFRSRRCHIRQKDWMLNS